MPRQGHTGLAIFLAIIIMIGAFAYVLTDGFSTNPIQTQEGSTTIIYAAPNGVQFTNYNEYLTYMSQNYPGQTIDQPVAPVTTRPSMLLQFQACDYITKVAQLTTMYADFCVANNGVFNFMDQYDTLTLASTPDLSNVPFAQGTEVIVHMDCTANPSNGLDYYDGWYYFKLTENTDVYRITSTNLQASGSGYKVVVTSSTEKTGGKVTIAAGANTNYWDVGRLYVYPRPTEANWDAYLTHDSTALASMTDGSTYVDTSAEITANATLSSTSDDITFSIYINEANLCWGIEQLSITSAGKIQVHKPVLIMTTTMTTIGSNALTSAGWSAITDSTLYAEKGFYKILDPVITQKGAKAQVSVNIPIDCSAASTGTAYTFHIWALDWQNVATIGIGGTSTSVPTVYGFIGAYGAAATIQSDSAFTTSSGAGAGEILMVYLTTPT